MSAAGVILLLTSMPAADCVQTKQDNLPVEQDCVNADLTGSHLVK